MSVETLLFNFSLIFLIALLIHGFSRYFRIPDLLILVIAGYFLGNVEYGILPIVFSGDLVYFVSLIALILLVFMGSINLTFKSVNKYSLSMIKFVIFLIILSSLIFTPVFYFLTGISFQFSLLIAIIIAGASPLVVDSLYYGVKNKVVNMLLIETRIPSFEAIIVFILYDFFLAPNTGLSNILIDNLKVLIAKVVLGLGVGILLALICFKVLNTNRSKQLSPLILLITIISSFTISNALGGSDVLAVVVTSMLLGNMRMKHFKEGLQFIEFLSKSFRLMVGIMIGVFIHIPFNLNFILISSVLFFLFLGIRYFAVTAFLAEELRTLKERFAFAGGGGLGFSAIVLATLILQSKLASSDLALNYIISFLFLSILCSAIISTVLKTRLIEE